MTRAIERINKGFEAGRVSRQAVSSWLLAKACRELSDEDIKSVRAENFNALNALSTILKRAQESGKVSAELRALLMNQVGLDSATKKTSKSKLTSNYINDEVLDEYVPIGTTKHN